MARPRTPAHLKPIPTTVSMTPENRRWLDEHHGGNVSRFVNAAVADFRRANDTLQDAKDHRARTARRVAAIHAGHSDAVDAALSLLSDEDAPEVTARLCAMLLTRIQRLGIEGANAAPHLLVALDERINHNETPEPSKDRTREALVKVCCARFPECTNKRDKRRKDRLCSSCARRA